MPIDPTIVTGLMPQVSQAVQAQQPSAAMIAAQEAVRKSQDERRKEQEVRSILGSDLDDDAKIDRLNRINAIEIASKYRAQLDDHRGKVDQAFLNDLKKDEAQTALFGKILQGVKDQYTLDGAKQLGQAFGEDGQKLVSLLPEQWDDATSPQFLQSFIEKGLSAEQYTQQQQKSYDTLMKGDWDRGTAGLFATADTPQEAQGVLTMLQARRAPKSLLDYWAPRVQAWTPDEQKRAQQEALTPEEREKAAIEAAKPGPNTDFTLSQGQQRFHTNPDGTVTKTAAVAPRPLAQSGGGSGAGAGGGAGAAKMPPQGRAVLARVLTGMPGTRIGTIQSEANRLAQAGDEQALKSYLRYAATQKVGEARQTVMQGRMETLSALKDAEAMLKEVPTGYLKGTWENTARALGKTSDPRLVELGSRMGNILAQYMRSISGAAVNESEAARLSALIPNYKNDLTVNLAQLKGFAESIKSFDKAFYQNTFGEHYDWVMSGANSGGTGGTVRVQGKDGAWYNFPSQEKADAFKKAGG